MHVHEARWLAERLRALPAADLFPLLNVGSSTAHFRSVRQPWIDAVVFAPLRAQGRPVTHLDLKAGEGIDLTGDLTDPDVLRDLATRGFRAVLCSNLLEHVTDRGAVSRGLAELVPPGGYLLVTVPRGYPYHPDPIDTRYRPTVAELAAEFPSLTLVEGEELDCGSFLESLSGGWRELALRLGWLPFPFVRWRGWVTNVNRLVWAGRRYRATCAVFRRAAA